MDVSSPPSATVAELKEEAELEKLRVETQLLREQLTPAHRRRESIKLIAGASGLLLAVVALVGAFLSVMSYLRDSARSRELRIEERLDRALQSLADSDPNKRLAGVVSLSSFLPEADTTRKTQVITSLANSLALESNSTVQSAILTVFEDLQPAPNPGESAVLNSGLKSLVQVNRGLVKEGLSQLGLADGRFQEWPDKIVSRVQPTAEGIEILLRKGASQPDLSRLYLAHTNLAGLDLSKYSFDESILRYADLSRATLVEATFAGAVLEGTNFISADLRGAKLTDPSGRPLLLSNTRIDEAMKSTDTKYVHVSPPDFSCADLRGADFSGQSLFPVVENDLKPLKLDLSIPSFWGANLEGADLRSISLFGMTGVKGDGPAVHAIITRNFVFEYKSMWTRPATHGLTIYGAILREDGGIRASVADRFSESLDLLPRAFSWSNWMNAQLPRGIRELVRRRNPPARSPPAQLGISDNPRCTPRASW